MNDTITRYGHGVEVLGLDGKLRELKYSVPTAPRVRRKPSCLGVVDGAGNIQHPIGFLEGEKRTDRIEIPRDKVGSKNLTDDQLMEVYIRTGSKAAVAKHFAISYDAVKGRFARMDADTPAMRQINERNERIATEWQEGKTVVELSKIHKLDHRKIRQILNKSGFLNFMMPRHKT